MSNVVIENKKIESNLAKKTNRKKFMFFFRAAWAMQAMWNSERQMNTAFMYGMSKTIDELYPDPKDIEHKKEAYRRSLQFFNITPQFGSFVLGMASAMEEDLAEHRESFNPEIIGTVKTSLMGPLSGIGDTLFQGVVRVIAMGIGISLAQQGSILGPIIAMIISAAVSIPLTYLGGKYGYLNGKKMVSRISKSNLMEKVMYVCNILGLIVVGAMVANLVKITTPLAYGEALKVQAILDQILPKLLPLALTGLMYWRVKKGTKPMKMMIICLIIGVICKYFGILAS